MFFLFLALALFLLVLILGVDHVINRYEHTKKSLAVLTGEALGSVVVGAVLSVRVFGEVYWPLRALFAVAVAVPLAVGIAVLTVQVWRLVKQRVYDERLAQIEARYEEAQLDLEKTSWKIRELKRRRSNLENRHEDDIEDRKTLEERLREWEQAAGLTRIRTMRVRDWRETFSEMSDARLQQKREELKDNVGEEEDTGQQQARLMVIELILRERGVYGPGAQMEKIDRRIDELESERQRRRRQLEELEADRERWRRRKAAFLDDKVKLD